MKRYYRKATCWYNDDGEFGAKTGWLVQLPYMAEIGGMSAVSRPVKEVHSDAKKVSGFTLKLVKAFGEQVCNKEEHGYDIWAVDQFYTSED